MVVSIFSFILVYLYVIPYFVPEPYLRLDLLPGLVFYENFCLYLIYYIEKMSGDAARYGEIYDLRAKRNFIFYGYIFALWDFFGLFCK